VAVPDGEGKAVSLLNRVVLVVDDDPDICWALDHLLGGLGAHCIRALDCQGALEATRLNRPALVLLDAKLPDMDGLEVARQIGGAAPGVPVLMVSGYFYKDDPAIQAALEQGLICGFVEKPFSHAAIVEAMETALGSQAPADLTCLPAVRCSEISS
jgi:CheY-like chemotaxis protein